MRRTWIRSLVVVLPLLVVAGALVVVPGGFGAGTLERQLAEYRDAGLDHNYDELVWHVAQPFVQRTALERTMTVNSARVAGGLNVYVFRADPKNYFDHDLMPLVEGGVVDQYAEVVGVQHGVPSGGRAVVSRSASTASGVVCSAGTRAGGSCPAV